MVGMERSNVNQRPVREEDRIHERGGMQVPFSKLPRDSERPAIGYSIAHHDVPEQARTKLPSDAFLMVA